MYLNYLTLWENFFLCFSNQSKDKNINNTNSYIININICRQIADNTICKKTLM